MSASDEEGLEDLDEPEDIVPVRPRRRPKVSFPPRTAKQVIDQAIEDNKFSEYLLYIFASAFVFRGMITLVVGMLRSDGLVALAGSVGSGLFFPAMSQARQIRRENIAIRLLESPLSMAGTSHESASALREFFVDTFTLRKPNS